MKNNKDNCYIVIEGKKYNIQEKCPIQIKNEIFEVKLVEKRKICDMSYMFYESKLYSIVDISKLNSNNIFDLSYLFIHASIYLRFQIYPIGTQKML